jgi:hypothetical protein
VTTSIKIKVVKRPTIKAKMLPRFPAKVIVDNFLKLTTDNGIYTFDVDYTQLDSTTFSDPVNTFVAVLDEVSGIYKIISLSALISGTVGIDQHITAAGPATVLNNAGIVRVDQAIGAAITLNMPLASAKTCPVLIQDWKGDAGTNNITINLSGADKFPGGLTSWKIAAGTGSIFLRPIAGAGYAL